MKSLSINKTLVVVVMLMAAITFAHAADKTSEKAREAVESAEPNDWKTLAKSAEKCLKKKVNLEEANRWLKKSILIDENPYNLTLKGDYHLLKNEPVIASEYYLEAMRDLLEKDRMADVSSIQMKLYEAKKQIYR